MKMRELWSFWETSVGPDPDPDDFYNWHKYVCCWGLGSSALSEGALASVSIYTIRRILIYYTVRSVFPTLNSHYYLDLIKMLKAAQDSLQEIGIQLQALGTALLVVIYLSQPIGAILRYTQS
jgi:hypothetical protein